MREQSPELRPFRQSHREAGLWAELLTDPAILPAFRLRPFKFAPGFGGQGGLDFARHEFLHAYSAAGSGVAYFSALEFFLMTA
jgi:hypothetical protein